MSAAGWSARSSSRIERKGLTLAALELRNVERAVAEQHYAEHAGKPFYESLLEFITGGALVAMVVEGENAIAAFRQLAGATNPVQAEHRQHPRRLRPRGAVQHRARLGLAGVGQARDRPLVPRRLNGC